MSDAFRQVPPLSPRDLLTRLAKMASRGDDTPEVTVMLHTGASVQGRATTVSDGGDATFLLADRNTGGLAYVSAQSVVSVIVHQARAYAHVISFGALDIAPETPPTRLGLKREVTELGQAVSKKLGVNVTIDAAIESFPDSPESLWSVTLGVRDLCASVETVANEPDGLAELKRQVARLVVKPAEHPNLSLSNQTLTFEIASQAGPKGRLSKAALRERLEKLL